MNKPIHVVAGIIWNSSRDKLLISRRPLHLHKGGFWEFPGGKVEPGEKAEEALQREIQEELGITINSIRHFKSVSWDYPEKSVCLDFYDVMHCDGQPQAFEGQELKWITIESLVAADFPEANRELVEKLKQLKD